MEFVLFGRDHCVVLAGLAALMWVAWRAAAAGFPARRIWLGRMLLAVLASYPAVMYAQLGFSGELSWDYALPIELCHVVMAACIAAIAAPSQLAREVAYFCGLAGTLPAVLTPDLATGFPNWDFIQFFWAHGAVLVAVAFILSDPDFKLRPGSVWRVMLFVNAYAVTVGLLNAVFGWNYGYLCAKPSQPSLFDLLRPWPWYLAELEAVALAAFWLLFWAWRFCSGFGRAGEPAKGTKL